MSGPGVFLFLTGLIMFAIGVILLAALSSQNRQWWMYLLLIIGILLLIWGAVLWFSSSVVSGITTSVTQPGPDGQPSELQQLAPLLLL